MKESVKERKRSENMTDFLREIYLLDPETKTRTERRKMKIILPKTPNKRKSQEKKDLTNRTQNQSVGKENRERKLKRENDRGIKLKERK